MTEDEEYFNSLSPEDQVRLKGRIMSRAKARKIIANPEVQKNIEDYFGRQKRHNGKIPTISGEEVKNRIKLLDTPIESWADDGDETYEPIVLSPHPYQGD